MKNLFLGALTLLSFFSNSEEKVKQNSIDYFYNKVFLTVEKYHHNFSHYLNKSATTFDSYFHLEQEPEHLEHYSYGIFKIGSVYSTKYNFDSNIKLKLKYDLPYAKKNLKLFLDISEDDFESLENKNAVFNELKKEDLTSGFILENESKKWKNKYKTGIHLKKKLDPFVKFEAVRNFNINKISFFQFKQDLFLYNSKGLGSSSNFYYNHKINKINLFSMNQKIQYLNDKEGFEFYHDYNYVHILNNRNSLKFSFSGTQKFQKNKININKKYRINTRWRSLIYKNWLFLNLTPELLFSEDLNYKPEFLLNLSFDMVFGRKSGIEKLSYKYFY